MILRIFENEHFVFCDKPCGVLTTPSRFEAEDSRRCLGTELQAELKQQIFPVHRLDFEVSGVVMFAKHAEAHRQANAWFEKRQVQKTYRAWTSAPDFSHIPVTVKNERVILQLKEMQIFEWRSQIFRGKKRSFESPQGKPSLTRATYLGAENDILLWDLQPVTGRPHQLRFELSRHGCPIAGDRLYGSGLRWSESGIALRSYRMDFSLSPQAVVLGLPAVLEVDPQPI